MYMMLMLSVGISNHVLLIPVLLDTAKRDSWVGASAFCILVVVWVVILHVIVRKTEKRSIEDWIRERYGNVVRVLMAAIVTVYLFAAGLVSFADTVMWTKITYLPRTPKPVVAFVFVLVCYLAARAGIRTIAIASGLLLPGVVILGYFVASANLQYKEYSLLTPLFTQGYMPAVRAMAYTAGGVFEIVLVLFMKHHVSTVVRTRGLLLLGLILVGLTVGPLTG